MPDGQTDKETAKVLADYFNRISDEFDPLKAGDIPCTRDKELPVLHEYEVAARIRWLRKPKSTVPGDIFPQLVTQFADFLAILLTSIYNSITERCEWPVCWKKEFITIIPKKSNPESIADLRNISCTLLASKMYESYILDWLKLEVALRSNQYGGIKGLGTDHLLVNLWQKVLENAEDHRAGTVITLADYSDLEEDCDELPETRRSIRRQGAAVLSTPRSSLTGSPMLEESPIVKAPRTGRRRRRLNYTEEMQEERPQERNHWTEAKWKEALALFLKFIDDGFCLSKINFENSLGFTVNDQKFRIKHAVQSQNVFRHIVRNAKT